MHEFSLMADLLRKIEQLAKDADADKVTAVKVKLGALSHITPDHFREHFEEAFDVAVRMRRTGFRRGADRRLHQSPAAIAALAMDEWAWADV